MQIPAPIKKIIPEKGAFIRDYWYVFVIGFLGLMLIIAQIIKLLTPQVPIQENTWNNITPGYSTIQNVTELLGQPIGQEQTDSGTIYLYESEFPTIPTEINTNQDQKVTFIKQRVSYNPDSTLQKAEEQYGKYDLELNVPESHGAVSAYVFLQKGVTIIAHIGDGSIEQVWYFEPTTEEAFMNSWGKDLSTEEPLPEEFDIQEEQ